WSPLSSTAFVNTGSEVWRLTNDVPFSCLARPDKFSDDNQSGRNAKTNVEPFGRLEMADRLDLLQAGAHRSFSIILMSLRVTEIDQHAIAHVPSDKAIVAADRLGDALVVRAQNLAQILGIESRGQCR